MKKKFLGKVLMMASFIAILGGFSSCKDYSEDRYSDLLSKLENQNITLEEALEIQKTNLLKKIEELQKAQAECKLECAEKLSQLEEKWNEQLAAQLANLLAKDEILQSQIDKINSSLGAVDTTSGTVAEQLVTLNLIAAEVKDSIVAWSPRLDSIERKAAEAMTLATENKKTVSKLDSIAESHGKRLDNVDSLLNSKIDSVEQQATVNLEAAKNYADDQIKSIQGNYTGTIGDLSEAMDSVDNVMSLRLDTIDGKIKSLDLLIQKNAKDIEALTGRLNKLVTSVVIQGTKNPVLGSIATPFNTRSNILAAYYGNVGSAGLEFPTDLPRFYVDNSDVKMTYADIEMLGVEPITKEEGIVLLGDEGNAGKLYMTVNPNTVDFSGLNFSLVNSQDEWSGATLSNIELSDEVLSFGITRANNGFYEAAATISEENLNDVKFNINLGEIKSVAKDIFNGGGINVTNVANAVVDFMASFVMDANGIKASWLDSEGEHSTYSQYGVAVTAVKPLSYSFGKDFNFTKVPGIDRVEGFIGRMTDKVFNKINSVIPNFDGINFVAPEIKQIEIPTLNPDSFKITIQVETTVEYDLNMDVHIDDVVINDMNGETNSITVVVPEKTHEVDVEREVEDEHGNKVTVIEKQKITIPSYEIEVPSTQFEVDGQIVHINDVHISKLLEIPVSFEHVEDIYPIINDLYGNIVGPIEDVNAMLGDIDAFMGDVNKMLDELNKFKDITSSLDNINANIKNKVSEYLSKFNDKFCNVINSANKFIRPVMLVNTNKGVVKLSQAKNNPTIISGKELTLIPTSYTMEYLAPAYKKLVGVTNVYKGTASAQGGDAACKSALNDVNAQVGIAEILAGDTYNVSATFQSGYVYEIVYTAVDFYGMVDAKKFYVTVK